MYQKNKRYVEAESLLLEATRALKLDTPETSREGASVAEAPGGAVAVVRQLVSLYSDWGKRDKATEWQAKLPKAPVPKP